MKFCPKCGKPIQNPDDAFCGGCGYKLDQGVAAGSAVNQNDLLTLIEEVQTEAPEAAAQTPPLAAGPTAATEGMPAAFQPLAPPQEATAQETPAREMPVQADAPHQAAPVMSPVPGGKGAFAPAAPAAAAAQPPVAPAQTPAPPAQAPAFPTGAGQPAGPPPATQPPVQAAATQVAAPAAQPAQPMVPPQPVLEPAAQPPAMQPQPTQQAPRPPQPAVVPQADEASRLAAEPPAASAAAPEPDPPGATPEPAPQQPTPPAAAKSFDFEKAVLQKAEDLFSEGETTGSPGLFGEADAEADDFAREAASPAAVAPMAAPVVNEEPAPEAAPDLFGAEVPEQTAEEEYQGRYQHEQQAPADDLFAANAPAARAEAPTRMMPAVGKPSDHMAKAGQAAQGAQPASATPAQPAPARQAAQGAQAAQPAQRMPKQQAPVQQVAQSRGPSLFDDGDTAQAPAARQDEYDSGYGRAAGPRENAYEKPRRNPGRVVLNILIVLVVFALAVAVTTMVMLYMRNRPGKLVDEFIEAVADGDLQDIATMLSQDKIALNDLDSTLEGWTAFCNAFGEPAAQNQLKSQLLALAQGERLATLDYPAVGIGDESLFLFIKQYHIEITGVELYAPDVDTAAVVYLDGINYGGKPYESGLLYSRLFPGRYEARVALGGASADSATPVEITIFGVDEPNRMESSTPTATVTVANCRGTDAIISIDGVDQAVQLEGDTVTLDFVRLGSVIKISMMEDGQRYESTVTFNDINTTGLSFGEYTPVGGEAGGEEGGEESSSQAPQQTISEGEIDALLRTFYTSYLDSINNQDIAKLTDTTQFGTTRMSERIKSSANAANLFEYVSASVKASSIRNTEAGGRPCVEFNASFQYRYKPRDDSAEYTAAGNTQSVQIVYVDGAWKVNQMVMVGKEDYDADKLAAFASE